MAKNKKNSRKALAAALGIMGIAGLSMASASQLTVNVTDSNIAVGQGSFDAACDTAVDVSYTYSIAGGTYTNLVISGIAAECVGLDLTYTLATSGATDPSGTVAIASDSVTVSISGVALTADLETIDIAIA